MYLAHWGLERSPFAPSSAPPLYYDGETQIEAAARLRFSVRHGRRLAMLVGAAGVGKSVALHRFAEELRREGGRVVFASLRGLAVREMLWQICAQLALGPQPSDDSVALFRRLGVFVQSLAWQREAVALALDDADAAGPDALTQLVRLLSLGGDRSRTTLLLTTAPGGLPRLGRELLDATDLRIDLEPWSESETIGYVQHALLEAGCDRPAFDDEALSVLATLSDGVPRHVNRLADHALLMAAAAGRDAVDAATVEAAHEALRWQAAPTPETIY
jgi:type II secretory pathway predicted ATPase ExeA